MNYTSFPVFEMMDQVTVSEPIPISRLASYQLIPQLLYESIIDSLPISVMSVALETSRLYLRPCQSDDLTVVHTLWTNDRIRYFLFDDRVISLDETRSFIHDSLTNFNQYGYGIWLVYTRSDLCFIGFAGCLRSDDESPSLIYGIHPDYCNRGYATEAMKSVLHYVSTLPFTHVVADVDEPNEASIRILKKLGMKQTKRDIIHGKPLLYFEYGLEKNGDNIP